MSGVGVHRGGVGVPPLRVTLLAAVLLCGSLAALFGPDGRH